MSRNIIDLLLVLTLIGGIIICSFWSEADAAIEFKTSSQQYVSTSTAPVTATPLTISCWMQEDQSTALDTLVSIQDNADTDRYWRLRVDGDNATKTVSAGSRQNGASEATAFSTSIYTVGKWHHVTGVFVSSTERYVYLDGTHRGSSTTSSAPDNIDDMTIGASRDSSPSNWMNGRIAEVAVWNVALSDDEVTALATPVRGMPLQIRPNNLVDYYPLNNVTDSVSMDTATMIINMAPNTFGSFNSASTSTSRPAGKGDIISG